MHVGAPDFVGVGVQKAGTSWWFRLLAAHPRVHHPPAVEKERHFFTRLWEAPLRGEQIDEYHRFFPRPPGSIVGEWTPDYLPCFWALSQLKTAAPDAKILLLLRDPVERYRSGLTHWRYRERLDNPRLVTDAFARGLYAQQLSWLSAAFDANQVLVLQLERCRLQPAEQLARTYRFLGLDDSFVPSSLHERVNATKGDKVPLDADRRRELIRLYREDTRRLATVVPDLELSLWPNFRNVGDDSSSRGG